MRFRGKPTEHLKEEFMRFSRENLLRPDEVAAVLGATPKTLANWRCERTGPPFLVDRLRQFVILQAEVWIPDFRS